MDTVVLRASDLDGYLTSADQKAIAAVDRLYARALKDFARLARAEARPKKQAEKRLLALFNRLGKKLQAAVGNERRIHVYSLEIPEFIHGEASRLVAKLRDVRTGNPEFIYYIQRAYEMLFNLAFAGPGSRKRRSIIRAHTG